MNEAEKMVLNGTCSDLAEVAGRIDKLSEKINDLNIKNRVLEQMDFMLNSVAKIKEILWNDANQGKNRNMFIFDIDGCIMPSLFPNLKAQDPEERDALIKKVIQKGVGMKPYSSFSRFLKNNVRHDDLIYFVTGRQESSFGNLTRHQLVKYIYLTKTLPEIIFYPEHGTYEEKSYLKWKHETIRDLLQIGYFHHVFDDMNGYFDPLENVHGCKCYQVQDEKDWDRLNLLFKKEKEASSDGYF